MTPSDILNLIGLGLGTIGAVLLAYDVVYGPGKRWQAEVARTQLSNLRNLRAHLRESTKTLPCPPYTDGEIQKLLAAEEMKWGPQENALATKDASFLPEYESSVVTLGAYGVGLIVLSFVLQFVGVLIHKPGT